MLVLKRLSVFVFVLVLLYFFSACNNKKKPVSGDEIADVKDFIELFPEPAVSLQFGDTILVKKLKDTVSISYKTILKFIPDSVLSKVFGKNLKPKSYPLGRMEDKNKTNYLLMKSAAGETRAVLLFCFDKNEKLVAAINLLKPDASSATTQSVSIDRNFNIAKNISRRNADGSVSEGKDSYVLNEDAQNFMLVMTEQLDEKVKDQANPIDTFARKQKYSADYSSGKTNLVSVRDGKKAGEFIFFMRFEKDNNQCNGELKGEAKFTGKNTAEYREAGDPCVMRFVFGTSSVSIKEVEGCGAHRGLRCSFDGNYAKRKSIKPKK